VTFEKHRVVTRRRPCVQLQSALRDDPVVDGAPMSFSADVASSTTAVTGGEPPRVIQRLKASRACKLEDDEGDEQGGWDD